MSKGLEFVKACLNEGHYPVFIHNKTGKLYRVLDTAINATNSNDGDIMIIYHRNSEMVPDELFCRESNEFFEKFESISEPLNDRLAPDFDPSEDESDDTSQKEYAESLKD